MVKQPCPARRIRIGDHLDTLRLGDIRDHGGKIIGGGQAIADEQYSDGVVVAVGRYRAKAHNAKQDDGQRQP